MAPRIIFHSIDSACGSGTLLDALPNRQESTPDVLTMDMARAMVLLGRADNFGLIQWDIDGSQRYRHSDNISSNFHYDLLTIDTIHLKLFMKDIRIASNHQLVFEYAKDKNYALWRDEQGDTVRGLKAIWNGKDRGIYLEISRITEDLPEIGCKIELTAPSIYGHGDNFVPLDYRVTKGVFEAVEEKLKAIGVSVDLRSAQIVRCDLNRNIALDEPFENYKSVWELLHFPRTSANNYKKTGVRCSNGSQTINIYDKIAQIEKKNKKEAKNNKKKTKFYISTQGLPPTARLEWQVKSADNVLEKLGIGSVEELINQWEEMPIRYRQCKDTLFRYDLDALRASKPRNDRSGLSPTQKEVLNIIRWCRKKQVEVGTADQLQMILETEGLLTYGKHIKALPNMNQKHAGTAIRRMRVALVRELALTDENFVRRYEELKYKFNGNGALDFIKALYLASYFLTKGYFSPTQASDTNTINCYHCGSKRVNKSGRTSNGKLRYQCRDCKRTSRESPRPQTYSLERKAEILRAYYEGTSLHGLTRKFGVSRQTVTSWLKKNK